MKWSIKKTIIISGLGLALLLLAATSTASYWSMTRLIESHALIQRTNQVVQNLEEILPTIKDIQAKERNYIRTGNETWLNADLAASPEIGSKIQKLRKLTGDRFTQQTKLNVLESLVTKEVAKELPVLKKSVSLPQENDKDGAVQIAQTEEEQKRQGEIRQLIQQMQKDEQAFLQQRSLAVSTSAQNIILMHYLGTSSIFLLLCWVYLLLYSENIKRQRAEEALRKVNEQLEIRVQERTAEIVSTNELLLAEIIERKRAEEALHLTQFCVDRAVYAIAWINLEGRFIYVNDALCHSIGYSREELLSMNLPDINPDILSAVYPEIWQAIKQGGSLSLESHHRCKDGRIFPVEVTCNYLQFKGKKYVSFFARDISDRLRHATLRQQAEFALRESEQRLQAILDNSPAIIYLKDNSCRHILVNRQFENSLHVTAQEVIGKNDYDIFPKEIADRLVSNDKIVLESGRSFEFEELIPCPDGIRTYLSLKFLIYNAEGIPYAIGGISTDISDRKAAEEALRVSEERFRIALKNSPIIVFNQDTNLRYTWINHPTSRFVLGKLESEVFTPEDAQQMVAIKRPVLETGIGTRTQMCITLNGGVRHYDLTVEPLRNPAGEIVGITGSAMDITDVRIREEQLRAIFEGALEAILITDNEGAYVEGNPAACQLLGMQVSELLGKRIADFVEPCFDFEQAWHNFQKQGLATGELRLLHPDGNVREVEYAARANFLPGRNLSVLRDITMRKQAEAALRESEARFRMMADSAPVMIWMSNPDALYTFFNQTWLNFTGRNLEQELGNGWLEGVHFEDIQHCLDSYLSAFNSRISFCMEYRLRRADGEYGWILDKGVPRFTPEGDFAGYIGTCLDITERKANEEALRESQRFIQKIADTTPNWLYIYDIIQDCNVYANRRTEDFFQCTQAEIQAIGSRILSDFLHPEDLAKAEEFNKEFAATKEGQVIEKEYRMKNATDEWRWFRISEVVFTRTADGRPEQILGTAVDITELKRAEEIHLALEREKELSQLKQRFFSMVSHEFRTPISTILLSVQSLENSFERWSKEKVLKNIFRIQASAKHMVQLLEDILIINRAEAGKLEFNPSSIDIRKLCYYLTEEMRLIAGSKNSIIFVSQGDSPELATKSAIDEKLLRSIITNLLSNAIRYSPQGSHIHFSLVCDRQEAILQISDKGIGILPEDQPHLFEPFYRGENVGNIAGSGLGLTVTKKCVDLHGGTIAVKSEVGVGTTCTVTLPLHNPLHNLERTASLHPD
ncbi:PAS domain S-box protein [Coleofasciculus sp. FACHB-1120]|uniref:PAS domain S-box protein n=1 Tax=Coleofasciculus sp. FACHB-1120 TaxID=2692783 RepID=UPI0016848B3E|nr:PAS domain S-box protein [Coleofasciculus sp. FACHB-1120]MBD2740729.1 PAS domain S-box protein [Coleofasciculus sp. FACHB-1120]